MKKLSIAILATASCALLLAMPAAVAEKPAPAAKKTAHAAAMRRNAWPAETMTGKIESVNSDEHMVIVEGANDVPFDMIVTAKTRITYGERRITLQDLAKDQSKTATIISSSYRSGAAMSRSRSWSEGSPGRRVGDDALANRGVGWQVAAIFQTPLLECVDGIRIQTFFVRNERP